MLSYLRIENFALIDRLELELSPGLTVLSGETGAGKSIILAAMGLILGQRAAGDLVRQGAEQAVIEALFTVDEHGPAAAVLAEDGGAALEPGGELVIRRVVNREGRNRVQVGGTLATLALLGRLGPELVSVVGQHESTSLLRADQHLALLDAFAGLDDQRGQVGRAAAQVRDLDGRIKALGQELERRERRRDDLLRAVEELEAANLRPGEEDELRQERHLLAGAERMGNLGRQAFDGLYAAEGSLLERAGKLRGQLKDLTAIDQRAAGLAAKAEEAFFLLEDLAMELRAYNGKINFDPERLDWIEARLHQLQRLGRKYGGDAPAALESARQELASLETGQDALRELAAQRQAALESALALAEALSDRRQQAASRLARAVEAELAQLGMTACRFEAQFIPPAGAAVATDKGPLGPAGLEGCEFLIAPNPGEGLRKLARIASGGELSRLLLALRGVVAQKMGLPTMVFDEVDAGVGGATGSAIGRKLAQLSRGAQVICITHLPQIAAWADSHIAVVKQIDGGRTATALAPLDERGRLAELARMLAGPDDQGTARRHAEELLAAARRQKQAQ